MADFKFTFGKHQGESIRTVPVKYLQWCSREQMYSEVRAAVCAELKRRGESVPAAPLRSFAEFDRTQRQLAAAIVVHGRKYLARRFHPTHLGGNVNLAQELEVVADFLEKQISITPSMSASPPRLPSSKMGVTRS